MNRPSFAPPAFKRIVQNRLAVDDLRFDLTLDDWPRLDDRAIFNPSHSLTYRLSSMTYGAGCYDAEGNGNAFAPMGSIVFIPAHRALRLRGAGGSLRHGRLEFPLGRFPELDAMLAALPAGRLKHCMNIRNRNIVQTLYRLVQEARSPDRTSERILDNLGSVLCCDIQRYLSTAKERSPNTADSEAEFRHAVERHLLSLEVFRISSEEMAKSLSMSNRNFSRLFKNIYGITFGQHIIEERIARAKSMIEDGNLPFKEISYLCGFADHSAFSSQFRSMTGVAPSAYRSLCEAKRPA